MPRASIPGLVEWPGGVRTRPRSVARGVIAGDVNALAPALAFVLAPAVFIAALIVAALMLAFIAFALGDTAAL